MGLPYPYQNYKHYSFPSNTTKVDIKEHQSVIFHSFHWFNIYKPYQCRCLFQNNKNTIINHIYGFTSYNITVASMVSTLNSKYLEIAWRGVHLQHNSQAIPTMHQMKCFIDMVKCQIMCNVLIHFNLLQVPRHSSYDCLQLCHIWWPMES